MDLSVFAAEGGWQAFELQGGEWAVLLLSVAAALLALVVGLYLARSVLAADQGTPKMREIAKAIQDGAAAYLKRQFRTIAVIVVPVAAIVFFTSTEILRPDESSALSFAASGTARTVAFILGCVASGLTGYIGMTLATRGNVRTAAAAREGSMADALTVAFRTGGVAGMFTVGLGLLGASLIIIIFQNTSSAILVGFGFGGSLLALFLRVGGGIFTKAADVGADLVGKVEAGIPEDDPRNPATIADNVGDNVGDCAGMAADLFESYEVTLVASIILGVAAFEAIGANPALGLVFPLAARAIGVIASIAGVFTVRARRNETNALNPIRRGFLVAGLITLLGTLLLALFYVGNDFDNAGWKCFGAVAIGLVLAQGISRLTEYYTGTEYGPVQEVADSAETGPATVVLSGTATGLESSVYAVIAIAIAIGVALGAGRRQPDVLAVPHRADRHGHAGRHRRHRLGGHVRTGQRQRRRYRRDVRGVPRRAAADHGQPRRRRQHDEGRHQGVRHRLGRHRRGRPVRQLRRDGRRRARLDRREPLRRRRAAVRAADQRRRAGDLHRPADRRRRAVPLLRARDPRRRAHRRRRGAGGARPVRRRQDHGRNQAARLRARSSTSARRRRCGS